MFKSVALGRFLFYIFIINWLIDWWQYCRVSVRGLCVVQLRRLSDNSWRMRSRLLSTLTTSCDFTNNSPCLHTTLSASTFSQIKPRPHKVWNISFYDKPAQPHIKVLDNINYKAYAPFCSACIWGKGSHRQWNLRKCFTVLYLLWMKHNPVAELCWN